MNLYNRINLLIYIFILIVLYLVLKEYKIIEGFSSNIDSIALSSIASIYNNKNLVIDNLKVNNSINVKNGTVKIDDHLTLKNANIYVKNHQGHPRCEIYGKNVAAGGKILHVENNNIGKEAVGLYGNGQIKATGNINTGGSGTFGNAKIGNHHDWAKFAHKDKFYTNAFALVHRQDGSTVLNAGADSDHKLLFKLNDVPNSFKFDTLTTHDLNVTNNLSVKNNSVFGTGSQRPLSIVPSAWGNERTYITTHDIVNNKMKRVGYIMPERRGNSNERTHWHHNES